jgi:hypothetical protein
MYELNHRNRRCDAQLGTGWDPKREPLDLWAGKRTDRTLGNSEPLVTFGGRIGHIEDLFQRQKPLHLPLFMENV